MKKFYILLVSLFLVNGALGQWFSLNSGTTKNLYSVHFPDALTGYAVGDNGIILKTTDGGSNWMTLDSGTMVVSRNSVFFTDALTGYVGSGGGQIRKTINGGNNWSLQYSVTSQHLNSVCFTHPDTGYAVGGGINFYPQINYYGFVLKTTNGGGLWSPIYATSHADEFQSVCFLNTNLGYVVGSWYGNTIGHPVIRKSTDGGTTWSIQDSLLQTQLQTNINSVYFPSPETGYIVGGDGTILKTTDGGMSWIPQPSGTTSNLNSVFFTDENLGHIVGDDGIILITSNGGANWITESSGTYANLFSVYFPCEDTGYIVGKNGTILQKNNGGLVEVDDLRSPNSDFRMTNYPNPFSSSTTVEFELDHPADVEISIVNQFGQRVDRIKSRGNSGINQVPWHAGSLPAGVYVCRVSAGNITATKKILLVR